MANIIESFCDSEYSPIKNESFRNHLAGLNTLDGIEFDGTNIYSLVGWCLLFSCAVIYAIYYLLPTARFNSVFSWFMVLLITAGINWGIAFGITQTDLGNGNYWQGPKTEASFEPVEFGIGDCAMFGLVNGIFSAVLFAGICMIKPARKFSIHRSNTPF